VKGARHLAATALCALLAGPAWAQNLLVNPGFETGDFTGWTLTGETRPDHSFVSSPAHYPGWNEWLPHGGNAFAALGGVGSAVVLSQTFATTPGANYAVSFYLGSDGETPNSIDVLWQGGVQPLAAQDQPETPGHDLIHGPAAAAYTHYVVNEVAAGPTTTIQFAARNDQGWWALDDVSVTLPEPSSLGMDVAGILAVAGCYAACRRRRAG